MATITLTINVPRIADVIAHFNKMGSWVATTVFEVPDDKKRAVLVEHWIKVAEKLLDLNNFNGVMELIGGLGSTSVVRLKKTWKNVSAAKKKVRCGVGCAELFAHVLVQSWDRVRAVMAPQSSFATYRQAIRTAHPPVIPYLGVSMQDMVFIGACDAQRAIIRHTLTPHRRGRQPGLLEGHGRVCELPQAPVVGRHHQGHPATRAGAVQH